VAVDFDVDVMAFDKMVGPSQTGVMMHVRKRTLRMDLINISSQTSKNKNDN
jgi:hypothetical protein